MIVDSKCSKTASDIFDFWASPGQEEPPPGAAPAPAALRSWAEALRRRNNSPYLGDAVPESELAVTTSRSGWERLTEGGRCAEKSEEGRKRKKRETGR